MTWSIVAHEPATGAFAVAIATRAFAVGAHCPYVRSSVGAVATQSLTNRYLGPAILDLVARGIAPATAIDSALAADEGRQLRQVHVVDRLGRAAAWTGRHCVETCGDRSGPRLGGRQHAGRGGRARRYLCCLCRRQRSAPARAPAVGAAGRRARRRRSSRQAVGGAAADEDFADLDIRVDDHPEPLGELGRLLAIWRQQWPGRAAWAPSKANPSGCIDLDSIEAAWKAQGLDLRFRR